MSVVDIRGLTKRYGNLTAVDDLTLAVGNGSIFGFLGPNGAGKTTTIKMLIGLTHPTSGTATVAGHDIIKESVEVRKSIGVLPDPIGFYDNLTARQTLRFFRELRGQGDFFSMGQTLDMIGLAEAADKKVGTFSRGMKQRLGLAQAIMHRPKVLLLDEPTGGLDPTGMSVFHQLLRQFNREMGVTIFLSTHILSTVEELCDHVGIIKKGKLEVNGTISAVKKQFMADSMDQVFQAVCPPEKSEVH
jgi:ABC-2 type transport system ATP-binding protein